MVDLKIVKPLLFFIVLTLLMSGCDSKRQLDKLDEWDFVIISDTTYEGVSYIFPNYIAEDTGKSINTHKYLLHGLSAPSVINAINGEITGEIPETWDQLRTDISEAEVILFFVNPTEIEGIGEEIINTTMGACMSYYSCTPPITCTTDTYAPLVDVLNKIYSEIFTLRGKNPTIIYALDFYNPVISDQRNCGMEQECTACWSSYNEALKQGAKDNNIYFVSVFDLYNGISHNEDPRETNYLGTDQIHLSLDGARAISDALREVGYDPISNPN